VIRSVEARKTSTSLAHAVGFALVLTGYWAPWVAHPAAGLAIAEIDFNEFPKFMPQVRSGELEVWRESFYLSLLAPAVGLVVWAAVGQGASSAQRRSTEARGPSAGRRDAARPPASSLKATPAAQRNWRRMAAHAVGSFSWALWLLRAIALALPITPSVFNVFETGEFQTQLRLVIVVAVAIVLSPLARRMPARLLSVLLTGWFVYGALMPAREFLHMLPALESIYRQPIVIGWGFWAGLGGFAVLVIAELWAALAPFFAGRKTQVEAR
jgi:hypothetical protein